MSSSGEYINKEAALAGAFDMLMPGSCEIQFANVVSTNYLKSLPTFNPKEELTDYIKWLLSDIDKIEGDTVDKKDVKFMLRSIVGEMYS